MTKTGLASIMCLAMATPVKADDHKSCSMPISMAVSVN